MNAQQHTAGLVAALFAAACTQQSPRSSPEHVVREFVERMQQMNGDPNEARAALELLSSRTRANLAARALRYGAASGKTIRDEAMLVPSRFALRFTPQRYITQVYETRGTVLAIGLLAEERAQVACLLEEGKWRVDLALPSLPPLQMRPRSGPL